MKRTLHPLLCCLLLLALAGCKTTEVTSDHNLLGGEILTVAHGCGSFDTYRNALPSNSVAAARRSILQGCDALEMDVQLTADSQLVMFHNGFLQDKTNCSGCIGDMAAQDVLGCRYQTRNGGLDGNHVVVSLDSMLREVRTANPAMRVFLNTKHDGPCLPEDLAALDRLLARKVVAAIERADMMDQVIIESLRADFMLEVRAIAPALPLLFDDEDYARGMETVRKHGFLGLAISNGQVTAEQVRAAHAEGYWLGIWGVRVADDTRRAIDKGPEFVMTDDLQMLQAMLKRR